MAGSSSVEAQIRASRVFAYDPRAENPNPPVSRDLGSVVRPGEDIALFASVLGADPLVDGAHLSDLRDALGWPGEHFLRMQWWAVRLFSRALEDAPGHERLVVRRWLARILCERANDPAWALRCREPAERAARWLVPGADPAGLVRLLEPWRDEAPVRARRAKKNADVATDIGEPLPGVLYLVACGSGRGRLRWGESISEPVRPKAFAVARELASKRRRESKADSKRFAPPHRGDLMRAAWPNRRPAREDAEMGRLLSELDRALTEIGLPDLERTSGTALLPREASVVEEVDETMEPSTASTDE